MSMLSHLTRLLPLCAGPGAPFHLSDAPQSPLSCAHLCSGEDRASPPVSTTLSMPSLSCSSWASKPCRAGRCSPVVITEKTFSYAKQPSPTGSHATASAPCANWAPKPRQCALWPRVGALSSWATSVRRPGPRSRAGQCRVGRASQCGSV
jgi:hypothetical protein